MQYTIITLDRIKICMCKSDNNEFKGRKWEIKDREY